MAHSYRIRHHCLQGDCNFYKWTIKENERITLAEVYRKEWDFDCPNHGPQRAKPFQAEEVNRVFLARKRVARGSQTETVCL